MTRTAVLLTVFNRKEVTLQGLRSLYKAIGALGGGYVFDVYMTDDGCTDGTGYAVKCEFPNVIVIQGNGNLYWNRGMLKAWQTAIDSGKDYDFCLWYNDDTILFEDSLTCMFDCFLNCGATAVISGAIKSVTGDVTTYGGYVDHKRVSPNGTEKAIDYMNGNIVLIPNAIVKKVGILDPYFRHSYGDWEYGYRARKNGFFLFLTPSYVGICDRHDSQEKCFDSKLEISERLNYLFSPIGHHPKEVFYYGMKTEGFLYGMKCAIMVFVKTLFPNL